MRHILACVLTLFCLASCGKPPAAPPAPPAAARAGDPAGAPPVTVQPEATTEASAPGADAPVPSSSEQSGASEERAAVTAAMKTYAEECFGSAGHSAVSQVVIHGDDAVAIVSIVGVPELEGERALVVMKRVNGRWKSVDYGSGIEPPAWYPYW